MKHLFLALLLSNTLHGAPSIPPVDDKIVKAFTATFPEARAVTWQEMDGSYEVHFMDGAVRCTVQYDATGAITLAFRYFSTAELLPLLLRSNLEKKFSDAKIYGVVESASSSEINYEIILEDATRWYHVNATGTGQLRLTKKFNKS